MSKFIILCGGTGGHLAPGIAVGKALIAEGNEAVFVISKKQVDSRLMKKYPNLKLLRAPGVAFSKNPFKALLFFKELVLSTLMGLREIRRGKFDALISFGGFNSLGFCIAASMLGVPIVLHEANRKAGKATRLLGKIAKRVYVPYGVEISKKKSERLRCAGYPVREEIHLLDMVASKAKFGFSPEANILLVLGGSQGALALNEWARDNFPKLAEHGIDVLCVSGPGKDNLPEREIVDKSGEPRKMKIIEFCDDMASAMSSATVVVARAGAGSIAEFARCRLPSLLVPYPFAADNHQYENAKCFERQGACVVIQQSKLDTLLGETIELFSNSELRNNMKKNLERVDVLNDMKKMIADLEKVAKQEDES